MNLLEQYSKRIAVSEAVYAERHEGAKLDSNRKNALACVLNNTTKYLNEQFSNSIGTQRADLGAWKKFCLNLTTVALPNLIANDLVIVSPLSSYSGYITYVQYTVGTNKGESHQNDVLNDPFKLGKVDVNYTSAKVVEECEVAEGKITVLWTPVAAVVKLAAVVSGESTEGVTAEITDAEKGEITLKAGSGASLPTKVKVAYEYDNVRIPQNDLPIVNARIAQKSLVAKARRVAVYYSQIAAFQAKQDYGFDLGDQLAEKAVGQLSYEIDTEITDLLIETAGAALPELTWSKTAQVGPFEHTSKAEHYEGFLEIIEIAKQKIYDRTKRFAPNYMLIASNILPVLSFIKSFKPAAAGKINGPYFAGTLGALKVFVTPNIDPGKFVIGVNGDDFMSSVAVYAPYMAVVPTQLLGYADGGMSQGFSTLYALETLNKDLIVAGEVVA
jgi:hypothetical protein